MTLRDIISYIVYSDFVREKFIADRIFLSFSMSIAGESFFPINRRPGLYKRLKNTKTKQAKQLFLEPEWALSQ